MGTSQQYNPGVFQKRLMKKSAILTLLFLCLASCAAAPIAAGVALGVWSSDQYSSAGGALPIEAPPERVWAAAKAVALDRAAGEELDIQEGVMRIEGRMNECKVLIRVLLYPTTDKISEIRVSARQGVRGRTDVAQSIAEEITARL